MDGSDPASNVTEATSPRKPRWLRVGLPRGEAFTRLRQIIAANRLHTVCESASCPNRGECWTAGTATLMILGGVCTRNCGFCDVPHGRPASPDADEPRRVAEAVSLMGLRHVVITCVTRDDLPDGGAALWANTIRAVRARCPDTTIEVLPSDFAGRRESCEAVFGVRPDIFGHNVETVPRLYPVARPQADYARSLDVLRWADQAGLTTKSGLMVGLGETFDEIVEVLRDLRGAAVRIVTIGQYLRPGRNHLPVARYIEPAEFDRLSRLAADMGFEGAECAPLVRSSYHAEKYSHLSRSD